MHGQQPRHCAQDCELLLNRLGIRAAGDQALPERPLALVEGQALLQQLAVGMVQVVDQQGDAGVVLVGQAARHQRL